MINYHRALFIILFNTISLIKSTPTLQKPTIPIPFSFKTYNGHLQALYKHAIISGAIIRAHKPSPTLAKKKERITEKNEEIMKGYVYGSLLKLDI